MLGARGSVNPHTHVSPGYNVDLENQTDENRERINCSGLTKALFKWGPGAMATTSACMRLFSCDSILDSDCEDKEYITSIEFFCFIYTAPILIYEGAKWAATSCGSHFQRREQINSEFLVD